MQEVKLSPEHKCAEVEALPVRVSFSLTEINDVAPEEIRCRVVRNGCVLTSLCSLPQPAGDCLWYPAPTSRGLAPLLTGQAQGEALFGLVWACSGLSLPLSLRSQGSEGIREDLPLPFAAALLTRPPRETPAAIC